MGTGFWREKSHDRDSGLGETSPGTPLTPEEALRTILSSVSPIGTETVRVDLALGRVMASDAVAAEDLPPFNGSRMDGYAVMAGDTFGASREKPVRLDCIGTIYPGQIPSIPATGGRTQRIMTGAALPEGADAVVKVEDTDGGDEGVLVFSPVSCGENVSARGEVCSEGSSVTEAGSIVRWPAMALLCGAGVEEARVFRTPRISVFTTGDELVGPGRARGRNNVRNATLPALLGLAASEGWNLGPCGETGDDPGEIASCLERAMTGSDAVVLTGGVSMGLRDHVREVLSKAGFVPVVGAVAQKPGKPMGVFVPGPGLTSGPAIAFGLPGNPVSSMVCAFRYLVPAMRVLGGMSPSRAVPDKVNCILTERVANREREKTAFIPMELNESDGGFVATPIGLRSSADILSFSRADGLLEVSPGKVHDPGSIVGIELFGMMR